MAKLSVNFWISTVLFQISFLVLLYSMAHGLLVGGIVVVALLLAGQCVLIDWSTLLLQRMSLALLLGIGFEFFAHNYQLFHYLHEKAFVLTCLWCLLLWLNFILSIPHALFMLIGRHRLNIGLGLFFGAWAYYSAAKFGVIVSNLDYFFLITAICWAFLLPCTLHLVANGIKK